MNLLKNLLRSIKWSIAKNKTLFWILFPPDNLLKFEYANYAELQTWKFVKDQLKDYSSLCEIGCFNGRIPMILIKSLKQKRYVGFDLNFVAIFIAKFLNFFRNFKNNRNFTFHSKKGVYASKENCELFVSVATFIYFSEIELIRFIDLIKINKSFKALILHEIFLNEKISQSNKTLTDKDINIHSISMIKKRFGKNYDIEVKRTFYPNWEKEDRISAILYIKKI
tara:strand:+ start:102 stop:773 length:672 start_codon:yes stop_codon:yes gene_type:complete